MFCTKNKTVELECIEEDIELEMILRTINFLIELELTSLGFLIPCNDCKLLIFPLLYLAQ